MTPLAVGYVPLLDAAPLMVAEALGFAAEEGLALTLVSAPSWSTLRDLLALGEVAAAQMLAPVPVAMALGLGASAARFEALSVLNMNGDVIGVSAALAGRLRDRGHDFGFADARAAGLAVLQFADAGLRIGVPFAFSMHVELVRYWLAGVGGTWPAGVRIVTVPPPRMAAALADGEIDAFAVGEPWGSVAAERGAGALLLPGAAVWAFAPEKVLAVRAGWAETEPGLAGRLMRAVWRAGEWLGRAENRTVASELLAWGGRLGVPAELIDRALSGRLILSTRGEERQTGHLIEFFDGAATFPWRSQSAWIGVQMARRHGLDPVAGAPAAPAVFRSDLYRLHLRSAGADLPGASEKLEGALRHPTPVASERGRLILPPDRFFDGTVFDPSSITC